MVFNSTTQLILDNWLELFKVRVLLAPPSHFVCTVIVFLNFKNTFLDFTI